MAKSYRSTNIGTGTSTWDGPHQLDTNIYDTDGISNTSTGTFTIQTAGVYSVIATVILDAVNTTGRREARINWNNGTILDRDIISSPNGSETDVLTCTAEHLFSPGDTLWIETWQNSGGNLNIIGSQTPMGYSLSVSYRGNPNGP